VGRTDKGESLPIYESPTKEQVLPEPKKIKVKNAVTEEFEQSNFQKEGFYW
jgi:hypothetical protein